MNNYKLKQKRGIVINFLGQTAIQKQMQSGSGEIKNLEKELEEITKALFGDGGQNLGLVATLIKAQTTHDEKVFEGFGKNMAIGRIDYLVEEIKKDKTLFGKISDRITESLSGKNDQIAERANLQAEIVKDAPAGVKAAVAMYTGFGTSGATQAKGHLNASEIETIESIEFPDDACASINRMTGDLDVATPSGSYSVPFAPTAKSTKKKGK